jgi:hypothetical protein
MKARIEAESARWSALVKARGITGRERTLTDGEVLLNQSCVICHHARRTVAGSEPAKVTAMRAHAAALRPYRDGAPGRDCKDGRDGTLLLRTFRRSLSSRRAPEPSLD